MQTRAGAPFSSLHFKGARLPADRLPRILASDKDLGGLARADHPLLEGEKL